MWCLSRHARNLRVVVARVLRTNCGVGFDSGFNISSFRTADAHLGKGA